MPISRRSLLLGAGAAVVAAGAGAEQLVQHGRLPGKNRLDRALGRCDVDVPPLLQPGAPVTYDTLRSARRGRAVAVGMAVPTARVPAGFRWPTCLVLHGRGGSAHDAFSGLQLHRRIAASSVVALVSVDGGDGYWHPRRSGDDPLGMLTDELLPWLARRGFATSRVAVVGWSMGGYGALLLATELGDRVVHVGAMSPALWTDPAEAAGGAFDDRADFEAHDVFRRLGRLPRSVRVDVGASDPFAPACRALGSRCDATHAQGAPVQLELHVTRGCHDGDYWESVAPAQLAAVAAALTG